MIIKCVAFFWVGNNIDIPSIYVKSIRLIYGDNIIIFQLTDHNTVEVEGIDKVLRNKLSKNIMVARLEAYSMNNFNNEHVLFTDADSLMINKYNIFNVDDIMLLPRLHSFKMNPNFPEYYPEFVDKNSDLDNQLLNNFNNFNSYEPKNHVSAEIFEKSTNPFDDGDDDDFADEIDCGNPPHASEVTPVVVPIVISSIEKKKGPPLVFPKKTYEIPSEQRISKYPRTKSAQLPPNFYELCETLGYNPAAFQQVFHENRCDIDSAINAMKEKVILAFNQGSSLQSIWSPPINVKVCKINFLILLIVKFVIYHINN
jgi:hypothetical protein